VHSSYRLPHDVRDRLAAALKPLRNRDACMALATFIGRFWTAPKRLGVPFVLDRRALAPVEALGLSEARIRGAIRALERVGFLDRAVTGGRTHQATAEGLHRRPVAFSFAAAYRDAFDAANKRAAVARGRRLRAGRTQAPAAQQRASTAPPVARPANSPKYKPSEAIKVHLGEKRAAAPLPTDPNPKLEAALARWLRAAEEQGRLGSNYRDSGKTLRGCASDRAS
jgi:hypothetical protein